jgi:pimeloyl-ACP methyl ester carboxylesterase
MTVGNGSAGSNGAPTNGVSALRPETLGDLGARSAAWASLRSEFVDVRGTLVHVVRGGRTPADGGADVPHLFVHGLGGGASNWFEVMGALGEDREVITMDLPGFGRTVPPRHSGGAPGHPLRGSPHGRRGALPPGPPGLRPNTIDNASYSSPFTNVSARAAAEIGRAHV